MDRFFIEIKINEIREFLQISFLMTNENFNSIFIGLFWWIFFDMIEDE